MDAAPAGTVAGQGITEEELRLAARNHALPLEPPWNLKGYANNAAERIRVVVGA